MILGLGAAAYACGGFFCSGGYTTTTTTTSSYGLVPVEQSSERILFRVNPEGTVTTFVEVGYAQNVPVDFAWIIPIPEPIEASAVATASADLFNALERATAPRFTFRWTETNVFGGSYGYYDDVDDDGGGCVLGCNGSSGKSASSDATFGGYPSTVTQDAAVEVVAEAVVGPFAIEVITATDAAEFAIWLGDNGYDLPENALEPLQHYVDQEMAYLGVKLAPDAPDGPIDTLEFTYPSTMPMIPIILTSIASSDLLPIQAYVLADAAFGPTNWTVADDVAPATNPDGEGGTDYLDLVEYELQRWDGQAFMLEYAQLSADLPSTGSIEFDALLTDRAYLTRWRGMIKPEQMTLDPEFDISGTLDLYSNEHVVELDFGPGETPSRRSKAMLPLLLIPLLGVGWLTRRGD